MLWEGDKTRVELPNTFYAAGFRLIAFSQGGQSASTPILLVPPSAVVQIVDPQAPVEKKAMSELVAAKAAAKTLLGKLRSNALANVKKRAKSKLKVAASLAAVEETVGDLEVSSSSEEEGDKYFGPQEGTREAPLIIRPDGTLANDDEGGEAYVPVRAAPDAPVVIRATVPADPGDGSPYARRGPRGPLYPGGWSTLKTHVYQTRKKQDAGFAEVVVQAMSKAEERVRAHRARLEAQQRELEAMYEEWRRLAGGSRFCAGCFARKKAKADAAARQAQGEDATAAQPGDATATTLAVGGKPMDAAARAAEARADAEAHKHHFGYRRELEGENASDVYESPSEADDAEHGTNEEPGRAADASGDSDEHQQRRSARPSASSSAASRPPPTLSRSGSFDKMLHSTPSPLQDAMEKVRLAELDASSVDGASAEEGEAKPSTTILRATKTSKTPSASRRASPTQKRAARGGAGGPSPGDGSPSPPLKPVRKPVASSQAAKQQRPRKQAATAPTSGSDSHGRVKSLKATEVRAAAIAETTPSPTRHSRSKSSPVRPSPRNSSASPKSGTNLVPSPPANAAGGRLLHRTPAKRSPVGLRPKRVSESFHVGSSGVAVGAARRNVASVANDALPIAASASADLLSARIAGQESQATPSSSPVPPSKPPVSPAKPRGSPATLPPRSPQKTARRPAQPGPGSPGGHSAARAPRLSSASSASAGSAFSSRSGGRVSIASSASAAGSGSEADSESEAMGGRSASSASSRRPRKRTAEVAARRRRREARRSNASVSSTRADGGEAATSISPPPHRRSSVSSVAASAAAARATPAPSFHGGGRESRRHSSVSAAAASMAGSSGATSGNAPAGGSATGSMAVPRLTRGSSSNTLLGSASVVTQTTRYSGVTAPESTIIGGSVVFEKEDDTRKKRGQRRRMTRRLTDEEAVRAMLIEQLEEDGFTPHTAQLVFGCSLDDALKRVSPYALMRATIGIKRTALTQNPSIQVSTSATPILDLVSKALERIGDIANRANVHRRNCQLVHAMFVQQFAHMEHFFSREYGLATPTIMALLGRLGDIARTFKSFSVRSRSRASVACGARSSEPHAGVVVVASHRTRGGWRRSWRTRSVTCSTSCAATGWRCTTCSTAARLKG